MRDRVFFIVVIGVVSGILVRSLFDLTWPWLGLFMICAAGLALLHKRISPEVPTWVVLLVFFTASFVLAFFRTDSVHSTHKGSFLHQFSDEKVVLQGIVSREPEVRDASTHLYLQTSYGLVLVIADRYSGVNYGDEVEVLGLLEVPSSFVTDLGRTFNYGGYLKAKGTSHLVRYPESLQILNSGQGNIFLEKLYQVKQIFLRKLEMVIPDPEAGLAAGLLLGEKRALGSELNDAFRRTGIIHIVVLSGYNIMLVATFIMFVMSYWFPFRLRLSMSIVAIGVFALLVGLSATVLRASIMVGLVFLGRLLSKNTSVFRSLLFAGMVMLLFNPFLLLHDPGFQLSFLATMGLVVAGGWFADKASFVADFGGLKEFFIATLVTQIAVLPLLLYQIGEFSLVAVLVNLLVLPMVAIAMLLTFVSVAVSFVSTPIALFLGYFASISLNYIIQVASWFGEFSWSALSVPEFPFVVVILAYSALAFTYWWSTKRETHTLSGWVIEYEKQTADNSPAKSKITDPKTVPIFFR